MKRSVAMMTVAMMIWAGGLAAAPVARADEPNAQAILDKADSQANGYQDQRFLMTMTIEGGGQKKVAKMETLQKGGEKRLVRFLAPGDVKGTTILMDGAAMYMYLPQFQKVRRIASHAASQGFMDSDFTNDDMGSVNFGKLYDAELAGTTDKHWKLKLKPKAGTQASVEFLELLVDKGNHVISQIDYFVGGKAVKRQTRSGMKTFANNYSTPTVIMMEDLTKAHKTTLVMEDVKINSGLSDSLFTKQALERAQ